MISFISLMDSSVLQALYSVRNPFLVQMFIWVSELASVPTITGFTTVLIIILAYRKRWELTAGLMTSVFGGLIATGIIKHFVARPRPGFDIASYTETTSSFPSSHAVLSIAFYGFLLSIFWPNLSRLNRGVAVAILTAIVLAEGFSRLYIGVHRPSEVLAGYILGSIFLWLGLIVTRKLEQQKLDLSKRA